MLLLSNNIWSIFLQCFDMVWSCHVKWHDGCQSKENIKAEKESFAVFLYKWYDVWTNIFIQCTVSIFVTVAMMGKLWEQNSDHACHWNYEVAFSSFFTEFSYTVSHNIKLY